MKKLEINKYKKKIRVQFQNNKVLVFGPLGTISFNMVFILLEKNNASLFIDKKFLKHFFSKLKKNFKGVSTGWFKELNLNGIGYKSFKINDCIALDVGYSNLITYKPSEKIKIKNLKNKIILFSYDLESLTNLGILLKNYAKPDVYKAKGILWKNEKIKLKKKGKI